MSKRIKMSYAVILLGLMIVLGGCFGGGIKIPAPKPEDTYNVKGTVVDGNGDAVAGVTLAVSGGSVPQTAESKADGTWQLSNLKGENTIVPTLENFSFDPARLVVTKADNGKSFTFTATKEGPVGPTCTAGGSGTVEDPYVIADLAGLQAMRDDLSAHYVLCGDIDASATRSWADETGAGFQPIGTGGALGEERLDFAFTGTFDGRGYVIDGLYIDRPEDNWVGLFGYVATVSATEDAMIGNVGLTNVDVTGGVNVGGLAGSVVGMQGQDDGVSNVSNAYSTGTVAGGASVGGLVGLNQKYSVISDSHSTANISGVGSTGGLVGSNHFYATIQYSYSTGDVVGTSTAQRFGGLVGSNWSFSTIRQSYSTGNVTTTSNAAGGLVGYHDYASTIEDSYATGAVHGKDSVGGLVGVYHEGYIVKNSYSTGKVTGETNVGGLIGYMTARRVVETSYWDTETSEVGSSASGSGRVTSQMKTDAGNYFGWSEDVWLFVPGEYPDLKNNPR